MLLQDLLSRFCQFREHLIHVVDEVISEYELHKDTNYM